MPTQRPQKTEKRPACRPQNAVENSRFPQPANRFFGQAPLECRTILDAATTVEPCAEAPPECRRSWALAAQWGARLRIPWLFTVTDCASHDVLDGGAVENTSNILTVKEVANILRCSKTHVLNALEGKVRGLPKLTHLSLGRRKVVRKDWLDQWMEDNRTR